MSEERLAEIVRAIVEECRKDGQLVKAYYHYPTGRAAFWLGFHLMAGAIVCGGMVMWGSTLVRMAWRLLP